MSTRAIRDALEELEHWRRNANVVAPHRPNKAWGEVEAIERMAKMFHGERVPNVMPRDAAEDVWRTMVDIAKDAP